MRTLHNIYLVFIKELKDWEVEIKKVVKKEDRLYLLGMKEEYDLMKNDSFDQIIFKYVCYQKEDGKEICQQIKDTYCKERIHLKEEQTRIILLSSQKKYFNVLKMAFLQDLYAVGHQNAPGNKIQFRINPKHDSNKSEISMDSFIDPSRKYDNKKTERNQKDSNENQKEIQESSEKDNHSIEKTESETVKHGKVNEEESIDQNDRYSIVVKKADPSDPAPVCKDLKDAQAAVCFFMINSFRNHLKRKTGAEFTEKEAFQFLELLLRCTKKEEVDPSWKTMSTKTIILREESFRALRDDATYFFQLADLFYKNNPLSEDSQ